MEFWVILYGGTICCCNTSVNGENSVFVYYNEDDTSIRRQRLWAESSVFTFLPENARVPGQQGLQQHWSVSLWLIAAQVVLQLSVNLRKLRQSYPLRGKKKTTKKKNLAQFCCPTLTCAPWRPGWGYGLTGMPDSHLDNPRGRKRPLRSSHCIRGS